jgi:protein-tyrosine phosphatase
LKQHRTRGIGPAPPLSPPRDGSLVKVLFVCTGNICRSPTAEGVFRAMVERDGLAALIEAASAGTGSWHVGEAPDPRSQEAALRRGIDLSAIRARQVSADDFHAFQYILAMDGSNLSRLQRMCPRGAKGKLSMFLDFVPGFERHDVPDPYYSGRQGFELVLNLVEQGAQGLLNHLRGQGG